ncbi:MG2 domain-containing protein [Tamlana sp. 2_MG-2023]|uniref:alpha-2-macroglobulin family protein n=1 Tax=unclassified Tamlana TaxID=2614803 RepID=UPI0026E12CDF|nr:MULTISPECIES: MG2 domain-containing protein [unclassified Tamlana]MDO6759003.1 MG2 domain-containing protein [Tamlana sp. 2_MG-2023]MDO6789702.1 MG2 domain-containing protein [Tamlana sp. 1_MG-2023]
MKYFSRILILAILVLSGCKDESNDTLNNIQKFKDYIFEVTSGVVSAKADIKVVLMSPMKDISSEVELDNSILKVSPKVPGKVVALNNRTIAFIPEKKFDSDTRYTFKLDLGAVQDVSNDYKTFVFDIKTIKQDFQVITNNLESYSRDWQYLNGTLRASDNILKAIAEKLITVKQKGKSLPIKILTEQVEGHYFKFIIDSIQRFEKDSPIEIEWDGSDFDIDTEGDYTFNIPGKNNFEVIDINVFDENKYVEINFSDPVKKNFNLDGFITIGDRNNLSFSFINNVVRVYVGDIKESETLTIHSGIINLYGYKLKRSLRKEITFEDIKPQVKLLQNGTILPTSENLKFNFEAVNLKAVDITVIKIFEDNVLQFLQNNDLKGSEELLRVARPIAKKTINLSKYEADLSNWRSYAVDLKEIINPDPGAIYRVEISFNKQYSNFKCENGDDSEIIETVINYDQEEAASSNWDNAYYGEGDNEYNWRASENPCEHSYYRNKKVSTNILASNIGVIVKQGSNNNYFIAVSDIITTNPISDAEVKFYNYQQQLIGRQKSDAEGKLTFPASSKAYFAVVTKNNISTYVKLNDGNALSVSKFDVDGAKLKRGLKGFIYGERGVWRPGDTLHLSFMLNDKNNKLPENHPVKLEVFEPAGSLYFSAVNTNGLNNFYKFTVPTYSDSYTGSWMAKVSVGGAVFTKKLRIEFIKPNRLKIKTSIPDKVITNKEVNGDLEATWLHGAVAKNLQADVTVTFNSIKTNFKAFPSYEFDDPTKTFSGKEQTVFNNTIDSDGKAKFSFHPSTGNSAPGLLKATFVSKVYEEGGDFSTDAFSANYASYSSYVGLLTPKGDAARDMLLTDTKHKFEIATVDAHGKPTAVEDLKVTIFKVNYNWWWNEDEDNLSSFDTSLDRDEAFSTTVSTNSEGKGTFDFELKYPEWGRYLVYVYNKESGHSTGKTVFIDWPGWAGKARKGDPSAATMLSFSTDKTDYKVGEKALVTFPSSGSGRALVTVENGSGVIKSLWVKAGKGDTKFELPITTDMTPNVYINISLLQNHNNTKNDLPIRMFGLAGINVENPETKLQPEIRMPDVLAPEKDVTIKVSEANGIPMTYSIAIVDEGLLDLSRFKTPNPWDVFYQKEALGVKTWDIYDDVIGAFGGNINQVFSIGGDGMLHASKNKKANRFKPVVIYQGPFKLDAKKTETHKIKIPKYIGAVKTMVVAHNPDIEAYGSSEKSTPVRKPLMVLASIARKVAPGEKVRIPVTVFAMENKIKNVNVSIKLNDVFKIIGKSTKSLYFSSPDEKMAYFDVEVLKDGIGEIDINVSGHGEKASYKLELDAFNPNPETLETTDVAVEPNGIQTISFDTFGVEGTNGAKLEISAFPSIDFASRLEYLIAYPHGCVEQTTSAAFPQLYINDVFKISEEKKDKTQKNIQQAIDKLAKFQKSNGGFSYWQNQNYANDWSTSYVGHFLIEAEKKGFVLPLDFKTRWIKYQEIEAKRWSASSNELAQAYRLYTLALAKQADKSSMNRFRELANQGKLNHIAKLRLAAAYALSGKKSVAKDLIRDFDVNVDLEGIESSTSNYGSKHRNLAMILETYVLLEESLKAKTIADIIASELSSKNYMSTQTTSYCLLAMSKYATYVGNKGINVVYNLNGSKNQSVKTNKAVILDDFKVHSGHNAIKIENKNDNLIYVRLINEGILPIGSEKTIEKNMTVNMAFTDKSGQYVDVSNLSQGTNFVAHIVLGNHTGSKVNDVALKALFPSGWEIVNSRFNTGSSLNSSITHEDIRDDRVNFYFDMAPGQEKSFKVLLNASYLGSYYLPGIQAEAMYDQDYFVRNQGRWVKVTE